MTDDQLIAMFQQKSFLDHLMDTMEREVLTVVKSDWMVCYSLEVLKTKGFVYEAKNMGPRSDERYFVLTWAGTKYVWSKRVEAQRISSKGTAPVQSAA